MIIEVKDLTIGSFQGAINLVYEDKPANNEVVEVLKAKKVFEPPHRSSVNCFC